MFDEFFNEEEQEFSRTVFERIDATIAKKDWERTAVQEVADKHDPFRVLIASMLSARTREEGTRVAVHNLFALADTPEKMLNLSDAQILKAIQPVTYPESKVAYVRDIAEKLVEKYDSKVPTTLDELTDFAGVGWKSAVLTQWLAFGIAEEICVDVHVARIGQRLGLVNPKTKQPQKVSQELMQVVPEELWGRWNPLMVRFGREVCQPTYPKCKSCPLNDICPKVGVKA